MPVPDFQSIFLPLLEFCADGEEHSIKEAREHLAKYFDLSPEDQAEMLPSGTQRTFDNRVAWAKSYLVQAKVLSSTRRAHFRITDRGRELLNQGHERIDIKILNQYPEFVEFHRSRSKNEGNGGGTITTSPEEQLQEAYEGIRRELANQLLEKIISNSPAFFERLVVDLMIAMGYGGSRAEAGRSIGQSGDEGIDGIINEDKLGLDVIYLQAKKWDPERVVGRPEIQKFVGALHGKRAKKGVFITTGKFSSDAYDYVKSIEPKVILIDGKTLANYMIDHNLGVSRSVSYEIKRIDSDYFDEE